MNPPPDCPFFMVSRPPETVARAEGFALWVGGERSRLRGKNSDVSPVPSCESFSTGARWGNSGPLHRLWEFRAVSEF